MTFCSGSTGSTNSITAEGARAGDHTGTGAAGSGIEGGLLKTKGFRAARLCSGPSGAEAVGVGSLEGDSKSPILSPTGDFSSRGVCGGEGDDVSLVEEVFDGVRA